MKDLEKRALEYHDLDGIPGKIGTYSTKPCKSAEDLSLAYTPGVAFPVLEIERNSENAYRYTDKGNLVAVISNGTAILGLGDRGALASKPVMEGKAVLFMRFADIDVFDIEINEKDPDRLIEIIKAISPSFGGINLEDIKSPECFYIEKRLIEECDIPVFHDDQHGTAIIVSAGLRNASELVGKDLSGLKVVISGAGAAGLSTARMLSFIGVNRENIVLFDIKGALTKEREDLTELHRDFLTDRSYKSLAEAMEGSDVFIGLSKGGLVSRDMIRSMNRDPIVFALANPDPEISYEDAKSARDDVIMATGRSDYPNQINNVLGFPAIFRGALDVRATKITENMKRAASIALSKLAKEEVIREVIDAYGGEHFSFGRDYIVPKPFDPRVIEWEAFEVAKAAVEDGVALKPIEDWEKYRRELQNRVERHLR